MSAMTTTLYRTRFTASNTHRRTTMNNIEFWKAAGVRAFRTFLQVILAVWTAGQLITEVDWKFLLLSAFSSAVYSLLTSILAGLPEVALADTLYDLDNDPDDDEDDDEEGEE